jgi:hypothetical protein
MRNEPLVVSGNLVSQMLFLQFKEGFRIAPFKRGDGKIKKTAE